MKKVTTVLSRIHTVSNGTELNREILTPETLAEFLENFLHNFSRNPKISLYLVADRTMITYAEKKYRDSWEEVTIKNLENMLKMVDSPDFGVLS